MSVTLSLGLHEVGGLNSGQYTLLGHPLDEQGPGPTLSKGASSCFEEIIVKLFIYLVVFFKVQNFKCFQWSQLFKVGLGHPQREGKPSPWSCVSRVQVS